MKTFVDHLKGPEKLDEGNTVGDKFAAIVRPVFNSFEKAQVDFQKYVEEFTEKVFPLVEKYGMRGYKVKADIAPFFPGGGPKVLGFKPRVDVKFFYNTGADAKTAADILRRAFNANFVNPQVNSWSGDEKAKGEYYIAISFDRQEVI